MKKVEEQEGKHTRRPVSHWAWPVGLAVAGLGAVATLVLRGCWHSNMSWPMKAEDEHGEYSYQVCMDCGIKRLFDERLFRAYGPYNYELHELIAHERLERIHRMHEAQMAQRKMKNKEDKAKSKEGEDG